VTKLRLFATGSKAIGCEMTRNGIGNEGLLHIANEIHNFLHIIGGKYAEEIIGDNQCGCRRNSSIQIIYCVFVKYFRKNGNKMKQCFNCL